MKKIIILISALLTLLFCLSGCKLGLSVSVNYTYDDTDFIMMTENTKKTFDGTVQKIDMDWISGKINFVKGDEFGISEKSVKGGYFPLYYKLSAGTLYIKWAANGMSMSSFSNKEKELTVTVTEDIAAVIMNNVSAEFNIELYEADELDINSVSGKGTVKADKIKTIRIDSVSGDVETEAELSGVVEISTVSAKTVITQKASTANNSFKISTVSGDAEIRFPSDLSGYTLKTSSVSGGYKSEFGEKEYGDGSVKIDFSSVSASIKIIKVQ